MGEEHITTERLFTVEVERRLAEAEGLLGYSLRGMRKIINAHGAVGAALYLLSPANGATLHKGFTQLAAARLLHLSLEQTVLDFAFSGLFPKRIVKMAQARLRAASKISQAPDLSCADKKAPSKLREGE